MIRGYRRSDLETIKTITEICFDGVSIDQNIEERFGIIGGLAWPSRKTKHIDEDVAVCPGGIFVYEVAGAVVGYITSRANYDTKIGWIPNLSVLPGNRGLGIGRALIDKGIDYLRWEGMCFVRIETLDQNEAGKSIYPKFGFQEIARQIHYIKPLEGGQTSA